VGDNLRGEEGNERDVPHRDPARATDAQGKEGGRGAMGFAIMQAKV